MTPAPSPSDSASPRHRLRATLIGATFMAVVTTVVAAAVTHSPAVGIAADGALPPLAPGVAQLLNSASLARPDVAVVPARGQASPCAHHRSGQLVVVSIKRQHLWACAGNRNVFDTPVTTGAVRLGDGTPHGTFAVQATTPNTTLTTSDGASAHVRYWIPFRLGIWGFHDASWQTMPFGSDNYVTQGSHGCVHVPTATMRRLFHWVHYGTTVRIT